MEVVVHPTHRFRVLYHSRNQDVGISKSTSFWGGFVASDENGHWLGGGVISSARVRLREGTLSDRSGAFVGSSSVDHTLHSMHTVSGGACVALGVCQLRVVEGVVAESHKIKHNAKKYISNNI